MRFCEEFRLATLRMHSAQDKQFEVGKRQESTMEDVLTLRVKAAEQRRESIEAAEKFDRSEMADNENLISPSLASSFPSN